MSLLVWLQIATTVLLFILSFAVGAIGWYLRRYVISEVEKNSAFRRWLIGEERIEKSDGYVDEVDTRFDQLRADMQQQHAETEQRLERIHTVVEHIVELLEDEHDADLGKSPDEWMDD